MILRQRKIGLWAAILAVPLAGLPADTSAQNAALMPCHVRGIRDQAKCLTLQVPERWDKPDGRKIEIHAAVLPAAGGAPAPDPVFILVGGPGQAAGELGRVLDAVFGKVRRQRRLVLLDQRGTGLSTPLPCPLPDAVEAQSADWNPARSCLPKLNADVTGFGSPEFIRDLEAVRKALGYQRINIWGASYGTRAALLYARAHPGRIRTMVLDGVLPPNRNLFESEPRTSQAALDKTLASCAERAACAEAFPQLRRILSDILLRLATGAQVFPDPQQEGATVAIDRAAFMRNLRGALYQPQSAAAIPFIIDRFAQGDARPLFAYAYEINRRITDHMYLGLTLSVFCTEEISRADASAVAAAGERSLFGTDYYKFWRHACEGWPGAPVSANYGAPVHADMPVLLLSGALDPVTPPAAAEEAARTLSHSTHFVAQSAGHNVSAFGCAPDLIANFIAAADASDLDPSCLNEQGRPPFLVGFRGSNP